MLEHKRNIPLTLLVKFFDALHGFWERTWSSNSISDLEKARRLDISLNAMSQTHDYDDGVWSILYDILICHMDEVTLTVEMGHVIARWCTSDNQGTADCARALVAMTLVVVHWQERNDSWVTLATRVCGPLEGDVRDSIADGGDSVLLAIFIQVARQSIPTGGRSPFFWRSQHTLAALIQLDIHNTPPRLQHDFCTLWNKIVSQAMVWRPHRIPVLILSMMRRHYIALHQGTDAVPTAFASIPHDDDMLKQPPSYPSCNLISHRPDTTAYVHLPTQPGDSPDASPRTVPKQDEKTHPIALLLRRMPSNPTTTGDVAAATQDIDSTATLTHPLEANEQQVVVVQCGEPDVCQVLSTVSTPAPTSTLVPVPASTPPVLIIPLAPHDAGAATTSGSFNFLLPTPSVVDLAVTPCHPPPHVPSMPSPRPSLWSATLPSRPTSGLSLFHLRPRGLVNSGNMCFANAVLHLLVHSPPSWNLFRKLCELKEQRGALECPETGGGATPLVDATMRFFEEFTFKEKEPPSTQQPPQHSPGGTSREDEEKEKDNSVVDSFEPTYLFDAMKDSESMQLKTLLVGSRAHVTPFCH
jgi:hypothetical protein